MEQNRTNIVLRRNVGVIPTEIFDQIQNVNNRGETVINKLRSETILQIPKIKIWPTKKLFITRNKVDQWIVSAIKQISFEKLTILNLGYGVIESIQGICRLKANHLKQLNLSENRICCMSSLRKIQTKHLFQFAFSSNNVIEDTRINELHQINLQRVYIEWDQKHRNQCLSMNFMCKLKTKKTGENELLIQSKDRLINKKQMACLMKKNGNNLAILTKKNTYIRPQ